MEGILMSIDKSVAAELASEAMEEFMKMAMDREEVLWSQGHGGKEALIYKEYLNQFTSAGMGQSSPDLKTDATRATAMVFIKSLSLVEALMNMKQWKDMLCCIVSRAITVDVISSGSGGSLDGALLLIYAELQVLSPLVPTRDVFFLRFCKQHKEGVWAVVDVSVDSLTESLSSSSLKCRKRPSGCLIQDMPNGFSKVTWVEHWEYDESEIHSLYRPFISSGMGFGAHRWLATLQRQTERLATELATPHLQNMVVGGRVDGGRSLLKVAERMRNNFCSIVNHSTLHNGSQVLGLKDGGVRVATRKRSDDPRKPPAGVLSAAASIWLPVSPERLFDFLRDGRLRNEWDMLSNGGPMHETAYIATGQDPGNNVSLLTASAQSKTLILQESCKDSSGFLVVYSPVDISQLNEVINGEEDSAYVDLLPCGFSILPPGSQVEVDDSNKENGALLTVVIQITVSTYNPRKARLTAESVKTVSNLISCTVRKIKSALSL
ncbi:homeobox-leucine zipper protein ANTHOCYANINLESS 2 isoform X1 [Cryptomeria japonica]|uniref:homeobox-leucine zipper protein ANTHOCYANINLESS 2 isoform X1 n=1 Tax=Cryptomeria japonica TaxID=3369 RepID=UPI0027D9EC8F|nr:homeobox-leucine zipper protein ANTHOCYANINLESS 2 isoform X1 [Cryptomeria japonica]